MKDAKTPKKDRAKKRRRDGSPEGHTARKKKKESKSHILERIDGEFGILFGVNQCEGLIYDISSKD